MGSGKVYVVHNDWIKDPINGKMPYKVGKTTADSVVDGRFHGIGLIMPGKFVCDFAYEFDGEQQYSKVESALHDLLDDSKVNGEWYLVNKKVLSGIRTTCELAGGRLITEEVTNEFAGEDADESVRPREKWIKESKWTVEIADYLFNLISGKDEFKLKYTTHHIAFVSVSSNKVCFRIQDRKENGSVMFLEDCDGLRKILNKNNITPRKSAEKPWMIATIKNKQFVEKHKNVFIEIANFVIGKKQRRNPTNVKEQRKEIETSNTTFKKLGIKVGTVLVYKNDEAIKVKTVDEKNGVKYKGETYTISNVAGQLTRSNANGYKYFKYNGTVLYDIRRKKYPT
jgi:hypothetical protein